MQFVGSLFVALLILVPVLASAQGLAGTVKDSSGGAVAGASVTLLTPRQAAVASVVTDTAGAFSIPSIAAGGYVLRVEAAGFGDHRQAVAIGAATMKPLAV